MKYILKLSLQLEIFLENLKSVPNLQERFFTDKERNILLTNYMPISVPPCFFNLLESIMCNRLFKYFTENSILYGKRFGFQKSHSTEYGNL